MDVTLGKYVALNTPVHRLDARVKLISLIAFVVAIFLKFANVALNFSVYGFLFAIILTTMIIGKVRFSSIFKSLKAMWLMVIFLLIINIILPNTGESFELWSGFRIYYNALYNTAYIVVRLILMISVTTILTSTTKPLDLTFALEWILTPLKIIRVPVHIISMIISLALRFIPTLLEETDRIMKAQASRGVDFKDGKFKEKIRAIVAIIVPLFVSAIQRSFELADAMESRAYDPTGKRTKYRRKHWRISDFVVITCIFILLGGIITLAATRYDLIAFIVSWFN